MARNEEKQLARLNRYYLQQQKEQELKKRPPRPKLDTLNTPRDIRKWLPTITRDIDFYVKQMEVACYPQRKVEEFSERIQQLKGEYRAYLRKLRALEPDQEVSSWANRPYASRKRHISDNVTGEKEAPETVNGRVQENSQPEPLVEEQFVPLSTPLLQRLAHSLPTQYGFQEAIPVSWNANPDTQDQPLTFGTHSTVAMTDSADGKSFQEQSVGAAVELVTGRTDRQTPCGKHHVSANEEEHLDQNDSKRAAVPGSTQGVEQRDVFLASDVEALCRCAESCTCSFKESGLSLSLPVKQLVKVPLQNQPADEVHITETFSCTEKAEGISGARYQNIFTHNSADMVGKDHGTVQLSEFEKELSTTSGVTSLTNPLNLDYSDSSEEG